MALWKGVNAVLGCGSVPNLNFSVRPHRPLCLCGKDSPLRFLTTEAQRTRRFTERLEPGHYPGLSTCDIGLCINRAALQSRTQNWQTGQSLAMLRLISLASPAAIATGGLPLRQPVQPGHRVWRHQAISTPHHSSGVSFTELDVTQFNS